MPDPAHGLVERFCGVQFFRRIPNRRNPGPKSDGNSAQNCMLSSGFLYAVAGLPGLLAVNNNNVGEKKPRGPPWLRSDVTFFLTNGRIISRPICGGRKFIIPFRKCPGRSCTSPSADQMRTEGEKKNGSVHTVSGASSSFSPKAVGARHGTKMT
jgi:hypothetical protein